MDESEPARPSRPVRRRPVRPRDALGRPLPFGARGVPPLPDGTALPPRQALAEAQRLLDVGRPFQAHEVLEAVWKVSATPGERALWRGLAQLAVGVTHLARGNAAGGSRLLRRGAANLDSCRRGDRGDRSDRSDRQTGPHPHDAPHGLDLTGLSRWARELAATVDEQRRTDPASPPRYTVPVFARASG